MQLILSDTNKNIVDLITEIYSSEQLGEMRTFSSINQLNEKYPIQCLRKSELCYDAVYLGQQNILIIVFDSSGKKITSNIYNLSGESSDFNSLSVGDTLSAVKNIAPMGDYTFLYTGRNDMPRISYHYLNDGYIVQITYNDNGIIATIEKRMI